MSTDAYTFSFRNGVDLGEVAQTLELAKVAAAGVWGEANVHLAVTHRLNQPHRQLTVKAAGAAGDAVVHIFTGLLLKEFGTRLFDVQRRTPILPMSA